eukprot:Transcript_23752.p2 GENE.Transcript_23752~~Transcript_23752.p2  ORF type:complete len:535 (+),score=238.14 Transcript_23752:46-1650(+)
MSEAPAAASAEGRPRRNTAQVTDKLAAAVAEAEELEAQGRYREAAELTALAMAEAHSQYVQSHKEVQPPLMPKPSQDYVERYKARLRVDWSKWDRLSTARAPQKPPTTPKDDDDDDGEESPGPRAAAAASSPAAAGLAAAGSTDMPMREEVWQPDTLSKTRTDAAASRDSQSDAAMVEVEIVHSCADGRRVTTKVSCPPFPRKAAAQFNKNPKHTVAALREGKEELSDRRYSYLEIAQWFLTAERLSKKSIGDYMGRNDEHAVKTIDAFLSLLDFGPLSFDEALRFFLSLFRLPGEAQQIDRIMQKFADRYTEAHPDTFASADTAYILAFSLIMLNTDAHSDQIPVKMTLDQFISNNRGIGENGSDLPDALLTQLYQSIQANEIIIEQREYIKSVREGWLGKQGGRVKTWKRRYVILSGNVLYYFKSPKDKAPAGFLPLENIEVRAHKEKNQFELVPAEGQMLKSVKMATDKKNQGGFEQGHHKSFMFKANDAEELDRWVQAIRRFAIVDELTRGQTMRGTTSLKKSPHGSATS